MLCLITLIGIGCNKAQISQEDDGTLVLGNAVFSKSETRGVTPGTRAIVIEGTNGNVDIVGTKSQTATLEFNVVARGSNDDAANRLADKITIEEVGDETSYRFKIDTPTPELSSVHVVARIPVQTELRLELRSGNVVITGMEGEISTAQMNGTVVYSGSSSNLNLRTRNGDLKTFLTRTSDGGRITLNTSNGNIDLRLPPSASAAVETSTSSGLVRTQGLSFTKQALDPTGAGTKFRGTIGTGATAVQSRTYHGDIAVRLASDQEIAAVSMAVEAATSIDASQLPTSDQAPDSADDTSIEDGSSDTSRVAPDTTVAAPDVDPHVVPIPDQVMDPDAGT